MVELCNETLAQIVNSNYRTAGIFEKYDLDYCCKGKRSLQQACEDKQLPVQQVVGELQIVLNSCSYPVHVDFNRMSLTQLTEYIVLTHHDYVRKESLLIFQNLQKIALKHGDRHPEVPRVFKAFTAIKEEMEQHMQKEEKILFLRIRMLEKIAAEFGELQANPGYLQTYITMMEEEHDHAGELMQEINRLTNSYTPPADACTTYRLTYASLQAFESDLHHHVHLENNILFPRAIGLFKKLDGLSRFAGTNV